MPIGNMNQAQSSGFDEFPSQFGNNQSSGFGGFDTSAFSSPPAAQPQTQQPQKVNNANAESEWFN